MDRIVVGTALLTFRFQFFYLQYLLPLLGAVLVYLGYRSLRLENRWFRLGWLLSALLLASHMALDVLAATPVMAMLAASPAVDGTLTWLLQGASPAHAAGPVAGDPGSLSLLRDRKSAP